MAERAIQHQQQRRKSEFLTSLQITPVLSFDELVKTKLKPGKFLFTKTGIIKIIAVIVLLLSFGLFMGVPACDDSPNWYPYFFPCSVGLCMSNQLIFYIIFSSGLTVKSPGFFVKADMITNLILAIVTIVASLISILECEYTTTLREIPGPIGITGGMITIIGVAAIFLMYRYVDDDKLKQSEQPKIIDPRKSVAA